MQYSWINKCQKTFQDIKLTLSSVLACFLEDGKFIINIDTSSFGIEARRARKLIFWKHWKKLITI